MKKFSHYILSVLDSLFARKFFYKINLIFLKLFIRFLGFNNHKDMKSSGEECFLDILCKKNIKFCLDIGANKGDYSRYLLNNSNTKVIAFEPLPFLKKDLLKLQNKFKERFVFFNFGLGNVKKNDFIYYDKKNLQWANFNSEVNKIDYLKNNKKKIKLKIEKLDDVLKKNRKLFSKKINLIKIDTEGYELEVLQGSKNVIKKLKPDYIQIEYNWHHLFKNVNLYYFSKVLKEYSAHKIMPHNQGLLKIDPQKPENNYFNYSNIVFVRNKL